MTPLRFHIPLGFSESNWLLAHLDNYLPGDEYGTPLIAATATGEQDLVNLLLEHGVTIDAPDHPKTEWPHPALAAIFAHNWDLALRFLGNFDTPTVKIPEEHKKWSMELMASLESDNPDVALRLFQGSVDINLAVDQEVSFLLLGRDKGSEYDDMAETRLSLFNMGTSMHAACHGGSPTLIERLQEL